MGPELRVVDQAHMAIIKVLESEETQPPHVEQVSPKEVVVHWPGIEKPEGDDPSVTLDFDPANHELDLSREPSEEDYLINVTAQSVHSGVHPTAVMIGNDAQTFFVRIRDAGTADELFSGTFRANTPLHRTIEFLTREQREKVKESEEKQKDANREFGIELHVMDEKKEQAEKDRELGEKEVEKKEAEERPEAPERPEPKEEKEEEKKPEEKEEEGLTDAQKEALRLANLLANAVSSRSPAEALARAITQEAAIAHASEHHGEHGHGEGHGGAQNDHGHGEKKHDVHSPGDHKKDEHKKPDDHSVPEHKFMEPKKNDPAPHKKEHEGDDDETAGEGTQES